MNNIKVFHNFYGKLHIKIIAVFSALLLLIMAPLAGIYLAEYSIRDYLYFPPLNIDLKPGHAPFSGLVFTLMMLAILAVVVPFFARVLSYKRNDINNAGFRNKFPVWGWPGVIVLLLGWLLAWSRFPWFSEWQTHTFAPLWAGYVIFINALTYMRSGRSLISHSPVYLLVLLIFSAIFWWYFEYLNQYVENWYYVNVEHLAPHEFFWYATLPFATVLPAVMSTKEFLETFPRFSAGLDNFIRLRIPYHRLLAVLLMLIAAAGLALTAVWTDYLFYMIWLAPLIIMISAMVIAGKPTLLAGMAHGKWKQLFLWGMAALVCGFFWEMWNYYSYTKWEYAVPFVERFYIFKMPLAGYAGYLPFGLQCGVLCCLIKDACYKLSK